MNNLKIALQAGLLAGKKIMEIYRQDFQVELKADQSPLTKADQEANQVILDSLKPTGIPVISEEIKNMPYEERATWNSCWIVDPLDGTKEFVKKNGEFTVNIALIENGVPVLGVVFWPVNHKLYFASDDIGSFSITLKDDPLHTDIDTLIGQATKLETQTKTKPYTVVASRSHLSEETEEFIEKCRTEYGDVELVSRGSSLKLCMVAEGSAHVYPRLAPTMEWDTAAAHAVAKYAGCKVLHFETRKELKYNKENLLNPYFIVTR
ncbi:3'(2'),5'-bisphosphate nucleotidase CysQ [Aequorivita marina]|uniref:3'(2'),5'-bisphosphate nucleotidase CysQ n=1 Tax=Aequorivita marina TaxID=3073654 RepID=UPI002875BE07|nr:3'(2'),5'-bisphosphate nucleotidase CysQ [Aequorivita sp. S2608]MDS1299064.1 3'(2'),5'-bisphosphate nucleotidase CysQ [Aequorivita sp. S2608]